MAALTPEGAAAPWSDSHEGPFNTRSTGASGRPLDRRQAQPGTPHLHRYAAEFDFRYNNRVANGVDDKMRAHNALIGAVGKRLSYISA